MSLVSERGLAPQGRVPGPRGPARRKDARAGLGERGILGVSRRAGRGKKRPPGGVT